MSRLPDMSRRSRRPALSEDELIAAHRGEVYFAGMVEAFLQFLDRADPNVTADQTTLADLRGRIKEHIAELRKQRLGS